MKVLHLPYCFPPDPLGGTEVYVEGLSLRQRRSGLDVVVAAPAPHDAAYDHGGIAVRRFAVSAAPTLQELYGEGDPVAARGFERVLEECKPEVVHLHAFTSGVSLRVVQAARRRRLPVVFTYHSPTASCVRGTLLRWGQAPCDGKLRVRACSACAVHGKGLGRMGSSMVASLPGAAGRCVGALGLSGPVWTALRTTELVSLRHAAFRALLAQVDRVVALCEWARALLLRNGLAESKVSLSRQGLAQDPGPRAANGHSHGALRLAFAGRMDPTKGIQVLVEAVISRPALPVRLDVFGVAQDEMARRFAETLARRSDGDSRVRFLPPVAPDQMVRVFSSYDMVAVPSQWLETGPLVVYEAFAAGVPVLGSDLGGIAELVSHGRDGMLVSPGSVRAWAAALDELAGEPALVAKLRSGVCPPRTMDSVCGEMLDLYRGLLEAA